MPVTNSVLVDEKGNALVPLLKNNDDNNNETQLVLREAMSALVSRFHLSNVSNEHGISFGGRRDLYKSLGYPRTITYRQYLDEYRRGDIAGKVVDSIPEATWAATPIVTDDDDRTVTTPFRLAVEEFNEELSLWSVMEDADKLAGIGQYSTLLLGAPGEVHTEVTTGPVEFLMALDQDRAAIQSSVIGKDNTFTDPRLGMPEFYTITITDNVTGALVGSTTASNIGTVHHSRVIHFADNTLGGNKIIGSSRLERVWNLLINHHTLVGAGSESAFISMMPRTLFDRDPEKPWAEGEADKLHEQLEELWHGLRSYATTSGIDPKTISTSTAGFGPNVLTVVKLIAAVLGEPWRMFLGTESAELGSSQDAINRAKRIARRRNRTATLWIKDVVNRLIEIKVLPEPNKGKFKVIWPEVETLTEVQKAEVGKLKAETNKSQVDVGLPPVFLHDEIREDPFGLQAEDTSKEVKDDGNSSGNSQGSNVNSTGTGGSQGRTAGRLDRSGVSDDSIRQAEPNTPEVLVNQTIIDGHLPLIEAAILEAWSEPTESEIESSIEGETVNELYNDIDAHTVTLIEPLLLDALNDSGESHEELVESRDSWFLDGSGTVVQGIAKAGLPIVGQVESSCRQAITFDPDTDTATTWAGTNAAKHITETTLESRQATNDIIVQLASEGLSTNQIAVRIKPTIGLRASQVETVRGLEERLLSANPNTTVTYGTPQTRIRIGANGAGQSLIDRHTKRYTGILLQQRAEVMARTLASRAANQGQVELWRQGLLNGTLQRDVVRVYIRNTERHAARDGQTVGINEPFPVEPGADVNCNCSQGLQRA